MVDPPTYRTEADPEFADRLEQVLLQRLTAPGVAASREPDDRDPDDEESDLIRLEADDRPMGREPVASRRRSPGRWLLVAAAAAVIAVVGTLLVTAGGDDGDDELNTATSISIPTSASAPNGWVAFDNDGDLFLARPGEDARPLEVAGSDVGDDMCPTWSPDGTRLSFGRLIGAPGTTSRDAELVIVPVGIDGSVGTPNVIELDGFEALPGFDPHPCATWAPDGRWVAFAGGGEVWVVDTQRGAIRRLPDLRPTDLEWRPGTDELAITGDIGPDRGAETSSTPVTTYDVSTGELRHLGSVRAASLAWSPDGSTLAYQGGENDTGELWLVDADGANERFLTNVGSANHGVGPVWSPTGERIAYQRLINATGERHRVILVDVADGSETIIEPPETDGPSGPESWYPYSVTWSPDGTTLLYSAWSPAFDGAVGGTPSGVLAVRADTPTDVTVLTGSSSLTGFVYHHPWALLQMWGRRPG